MVITHLGAKRVQGLKIDRTNDSLGSDADGSNTGITLLKSGTVTATINSSSNDSYSTFDIGTALSTNWVLRWKQDSTTNDLVLNSSNAGALYVGLSEVANISTDQNGSSGGNLYTRYRHESGNWYVDGFDIRVRSGSTTTAGGNSGAGALSRGSITYYVELTKNGSSSTVKYFSDSGYSQQVGSTQTVDGTGAGSSLQYLGIHAISETVSSGSLVVECSEFKIYDNQTSAVTPTYTDFTGTWATSGTKVVVGDVKLGTGCYSFDGSDSYTTASSWGETLSDKGTVACWFNADSLASSRTIISQRINGSGNPLMVRGVDSDTIELRVGNTNAPDFTSTISTGTWYHVAVTWDRTADVVKGYLNGVLEVTSTSNGTDFTGTSGDVTAWTFGQGYNTDSGRAFTGKVDDAGVWSRILTTTEIGKLANNNASANMGFYAANANQSCADGKFTFDLQRKVGTDTSSWDLYDDVPTSLNETSWTSANTVSDETWTLRGKIRFTSIGANENWCWIALTRNYYGFTSNDAISSSYGIGVQFRFGTSLNTYYTNDLVASGTSFAGQKGTGDNSQNWTPAENTDYYLEIKRTSTTSYSVSMFENADFSTDPIGTITGTCSNTITKLKYIKVMNTYVNPAGTGSDIEGYVSWWKFYDGTNSPSGTPTKTYEFVDGDAQLVSSLSDKANLKANYTMDSTALTSLKGTADWTEDFSETTPTSWTEDSSSGYANNLEPYKGSVNRLWFDFDENTSVGIMGMLDSQNAALLGSNPSNTLWTFRFKINFTVLTSAGGSMWIGFTDSNNAASNGACRFAGCRIKTTVGITNGSDNGGQALTASNRTTGGVATTVTTGTDYYVTVSRHTANKLVTTVRSGSHTGTLLGEVTADDLETATDDLRYWKIMNNRSSTNSAQLKGYLYDLEFFNDSATTTGCKNDFSATSALDEQTNLPVNTIFEQTDDTPTYWWKQSDNTWTLDGTTSPVISTTTSSDWTHQGTQGTYSTTSVVATGVQLVTTQSGSGYGGGTAVGDLGSALNDKWVMRFNFTTGSSFSTGGNAYYYMGLSSLGTYASDGGINDVGTSDAVYMLWHIADGNNAVRIYADGSSTNGTNQGSNAWSNNQVKYYELSYDGSTATLQRYTDSTYGTTSGSAMTASATATGLRYVNLGTERGTNMGAYTIIMNNVEIINGRTTWLE